MIGKIYVLGLLFTLLLIFSIARVCKEEFDEAVNLALFAGLLWFVVVPFALYNIIKTYKKGEK